MCIDIEPIVFIKLFLFYQNKTRTRRAELSGYVQFNKYTHMYTKDSGSQAGTEPIAQTHENPRSPVVTQENNIKSLDKIARVSTGRADHMSGSSVSHGGLTRATPKYSRASDCSLNSTSVLRW